MKYKYPFKINHDKQEIIMSRNFAKKQKNPQSEEFDAIQSIHSLFPTYNIVTRKKIKTNSKKEAFNGLTYKYMEEYILNHLNAEARLNEFNELRELSRCHSIKYPHIKKWFLETYPEVADFYKKGVANNENCA